jgi:hypothetical protein
MIRARGLDRVVAPPAVALVTAGLGALLVKLSFEVVEVVVAALVVVEFNRGLAIGEVIDVRVDMTLLC